MGGCIGLSQILILVRLRLFFGAIDDSLHAPPQLPTFCFRELKHSSRILEGLPCRVRVVIVLVLTASHVSYLLSRTATDNSSSKNEINIMMAVDSMMQHPLLLLLLLQLVRGAGFWLLHATPTSSESWWLLSKFIFLPKEDKENLEFQQQPNKKEQTKDGPTPLPKAIGYISNVGTRISPWRQGLQRPTSFESISFESTDFAAVICFAVASLWQVDLLSCCNLLRCYKLIPLVFASHSPMRWFSSLGSFSFDTEQKGGVALNTMEPNIYQKSILIDT